MANTDRNIDRSRKMAEIFPDGQDYGFQSDNGFEQDQRNEEFVSEFSYKGGEYDNRGAQRSGMGNFDDAEEVDIEMGSEGAPLSGSSSKPAKSTDRLILDYVQQVKRWKGETTEDLSKFVNNANSVDNVREKRLRFAEEMSSRPELIADEAMKGYEGYFKADTAYIARSDPSKTTYDQFMQRRAELRDKMFKGKPVLGADDYEKVVGRAQRLIKDQKHIDIQYEVIDLRKESALEHFDDPRFITEVYRNNKGLMDELLVDFDRKDLLVSEMMTNGTTRSRSLAMGEAFADQVKGDLSDRSTPAEKVMNFQKSREFGLNIRHNQRAITSFADKYPNNGPEFERGMSALDNVRWNESMWSDYGKGMSKADRAFISKHKGPAAAFIKAREQFSKEFDKGDPRMAHSFAVMEQAASKIQKDPRLQERLSELGDLDDVASLHLFSEQYKEQNLGKSVSSKVDRSVDEKMKGDLEGMNFSGHVMRKGSLNKDYPLTMSKDTQVEVVDGAHVLVSNNAEDLKEGKGIVMRLDGIMAPPEGVSTKNGKLDAGLESKANLEGVLNRHGILNVGMMIKASKDGEPTLEMRTADGESVSQRMLRDGYAIPSQGSEEGNRREYMTKQAEANDRGLWRHGFPDMDQSWRKEKNAPELTWREKRLKISKTANQATCHTPTQVARNLSRNETQLFGLPIKAFAGSKLVDREIAKVIDRNPGRIKDIYDNNMEILTDLRKRKDKLSQPEKVAHDQLSLGRRALGEALVSRNLIDAKQFSKESHELMSRSGIQVSGEGVRKIASATGKVAEATTRSAIKHGSKAKRGADWFMQQIMD